MLNNAIVLKDRVFQLSVNPAALITKTFRVVLLPYSTGRLNADLQPIERKGFTMKQ